MAREKAKLVIAEKTKIKKEMASVPEPVEEPAPEEVSVPAELPVEDSAPEEVSVPEPVVEPPPPPPEPVAETPKEVSVPPPQPSLSRDEIQNLIHSTLEERRTPERKYAFVDGMYVKIK